MMCACVNAIFSNDDLIRDAEVLTFRLGSDFYEKDTRTYLAMQLVGVEQLFPAWTIEHGQFLDWIQFASGYHPCRRRQNICG